jgi:hypothetical protein
MAILTKREEWAKPRPPRVTTSPSVLSTVEQGHVRVAIRFLAKRFGTYRKLAAAMGTKEATVSLAGSRRGRVSVGVALRTARAAGVPLENLLVGAYPPANACPFCGRCGEP